MEKLPEHKYKGHWTFWRYLKRNYNIDRPTKYCVIFNIWKDKLESFSCTEFDTLDDALDEAKELNKMYSSTPKPFKNYHEKGKHRDGWGWRYDPYDWDFSDGRQFWGYAVLDMIEHKFIKVVNGLHMYSYNVSCIKPTLEDYDKFFRGEDEIFADYLWDNRGEYNGWLQFRWGDRKNAIDYIEPPKKERPGVVEIREFYDEATDSYIKKKVRVVYVDWDAPLPKREKGIIYERPNKEPVLFPGDFGYTDDLNINEWSLAEEIARDEYLDKKGKKGFEIEEPTTSSIADRLGDDNPLLKLKFD